MIFTVPDDQGKGFPSLGEQVCDWIEANLCFGPGDLRGEPARLDDEKRALIWRMYEVFPKGHPMAGRRRFKRVGISLPKGLAKTELAAWIAAAELHPEAPVRTALDDNGRPRWKGKKPIGGPVRDPYIALVAFTEEQSDELCYGALKAILEESGMDDVFDIGLERIVRKPHGDGKAVSLANSPSARDGARTTFQVADETHRFDSDRLKRAHQTMLANIPKRKEADAWTLEITTAYEPGAGSIAEMTMEYARAVADGRTKDDRLFFFHRQASDSHDLTTEQGARDAVIEASGPAAAWRDIDSIVQLWRDPTTDRSFWERVYCNRLVQSSAKAFDPVLFKSLKASNPVKDGDMITLGFDGSLFNDSTGLVATHIKTGFQWVAGLWEKPFGKTGEGWQVPTDEVDEAVRALFQTYSVVRMYADPPYWQSWVSKWIGEYGKEVVVEWWTNRRKPMSFALEAYQTAMQEGTLSHDGDARLLRHVSNAYRADTPMKDEQGKPLWLIQKERPDSPNKIDLAMCAVLSWEARNDAIADGCNPDGNYVEGRLLLI